MVKHKTRRCEVISNDDPDREAAKSDSEEDGRERNDTFTEGSAPKTSTPAAAAQWPRDTNASAPSRTGTQGAAPPSAPTSTNEMYAMLEVFARTQAEANKNLIETILSASLGRAAARPMGASSDRRSDRGGNLSGCSARFDGSTRDAEALEAFIDAIQTYKECTQVDDDIAVRGLSMLLAGDAALWWRGIRREVTDWEDAVARLRGMYGYIKPAHRLLREIFADEHEANQRSEVFACRIRALISQLPYNLCEPVKIDIVYGLLDRKIRKRLPRSCLVTLDDMIVKLRDVEESIAEVQNKSETVSTFYPNKTTATKPQLQAQSVIPQTPPSTSSDEPAPRRKRCTYCKTYGHDLIECRKRQDKQSNVNSRQTSSNEPALRCYGCGQVGVIKSKCNICNDKKKVSTNNVSFNMLCTNSPQTNSFSTNLITPDKSYLPNRGPNNKLCPSSDDPFSNIMSTINQQLNTYSDSVVEKRAYSEHQVYSDSDIETILKSRRSYDHGCYRKYSGEVPTVILEAHYSTSNSDVDRDQCRHPMVKINVKGCDGVAIVDTGATHCIVSPLLYRHLQRCDTEFSEEQRSIRLADGSEKLCTVFRCELDVKLQERVVPAAFLVLPGADTKTLLGRDFIERAGIVLNVPRWTWSFVDDPKCEYEFVRSYILTAVCNADVSHANDELQLHLRADEGVHLNGSQRAQLNQLIARRARRFDHQGEPTSFITHRIKVDAKQEPIASPPHRMSPAKVPILQKEIDKLLHADIIEECESPWAANVVLVAKKDGGTRLCIDYRGLNAVTEPDRYPLPRIDDVLHAAKTTNFMTTLDLRTGYFQASVAEEDRDKTAFVTPLGTFRFKRMPMGLRNSGATFQRLMDRFKSNLQNVTLLCYLDDLVVLSTDFEQHLKDLEAVFERLELFSLRVNREKSFFAKDSVRFLGHLIVPGGIQVDPEKTAAVDNMAVPLNVKHLKCFLQTSSWLRRFIPNYAEIARPLTSLLKKDSAWQWTADQQSAFERIKQLLVSAPILRQADHTQPFTLRTDSSAYCLGAVLMQGEGTDERPIEYASRLLTPAERNYTTTEREALAVVWAVLKFRGYIDGAEIIVKSDHQPLRWLMSVKSPSGRLTRWALTLQEYDLRIEYTPGKSNVIADTLSRPTCADEVSDCDLCQIVVDVPADNPLSYRDQQLRDPEIRKIIEDLEAEDETFRGRPWANRGYVISDGVLYRYNPEHNENDEAQLVVPVDQREKILSDYHDAPTAGHLGVERTLQRLASRYYWPGMRRFVVEYIRGCVPCQRYKVDNRKPAGLLQSPAVAQRFEVVAVDLFGPLPITETGNRWILVVEDVCSRWVELFALENATSLDCAKILIQEVFLRYGVPRRLLSDNGVQFISEVMQQVCNVFGIDQALTPFYHPEANPVERKNRDLKPQLAIYVGQDHATWDIHLAAIRFAMNSAVTHSTGYSPAMLTFGREIRAPADVVHDMRAIVEGDRFVSNVTPYLKRLATILIDARDTHEKIQAVQKKYADDKRRPAPDYKVGDLVLLKTQGSNDTGHGQTPKFIPRRDGPYRVREVLSSTTYCLERDKGEVLGKYHASQLTPFVGQMQPPVHQKKRRGRPRKDAP